MYACMYACVYVRMYVCVYVSGGRSARQRIDTALLEEGTRLFVSNLNPMTTWKELKDHCKTSGNVVYANVFMVSSPTTFDGVV